MGLQSKLTAKEYTEMVATCPFQVGDQVTITQGELAGSMAEVVALIPSVLHRGEWVAQVRVVAPCIRSVSAKQLERREKHVCGKHSG